MNEKGGSHILLIGVAGSGKEFLLSKVRNLAENRDMLCCPYSKLIIEELRRAVGIEISSENLKNLESRVITRSKNTANDMLSKKTGWILSSHIFYKQEENYLFSVETMRKLSISYIVHVSSPTDLIAKRRDEDTARFYQKESELEIAFQQSVSEDISKDIAKLIGCKYICINNLSSNTEENTELIKKLMVNFEV